MTKSLWFTKELSDIMKDPVKADIRKERFCPHTNFSGSDNGFYLFLSVTVTSTGTIRILFLTDIFQNVITEVLING